MMGWAKKEPKASADTSHVGIDDDDLRVDLLGQISYFLPHLLALSTSSPFWAGRDTGLHCYRLSIFDELPRTGLPERFDSWSQYNRHIDTMVNVGLVEDASKIWWDIRPHCRFPTLEMRVADICTYMDDGITIAALYASLLSMRIENPADLPQVQQEFENLAGGAGAFIDVLTRLAETQEDQDDAARLSETFSRWVLTAQQEEQLFDTHRDMDRFGARYWFIRVDDLVDAHGYYARNGHTEMWHSGFRRGLRDDGFDILAVPKARYEPADMIQTTPLIALSRTFG